MNSISLVTTIALFSTITITSVVLPQMVNAQSDGMKMSSSDTSGMQISSSDTTDSSDYPRDSFTATGEISSLIITVPEQGFDISTAFKVILTGEWNLNVKDGQMANFAANFLASPLDGSRPHTHQIMNFRSNNHNDPIVLLQGNNASMIGKADIKINGVNVWEGADVAIQILNGSTITIDPDDTDTDGHFGDQTVNGIVTRIIS